jgi:hypothetical protein
MLRRIAGRWLPPAVKDWLRPSAPVPNIAFDLPVQPLEVLFPGGSDAVVRFPMSQWTRTRDMVLPLSDYLAVGALVQVLQPRRIFEIGTFNGSTTLLMALNAPEAEIFTLDLPPSELLPEAKARFHAGSEFEKSPVSGRIHQLFGRSESFDFTPYFGNIDLVYIDALHTYEAVKRDTQTAFRLLRGGGVILWDDYLWDPAFPECAGVTRWLNELNATTPCSVIRGTRLAVHSTPVEV